MLRCLRINKSRKTKNIQKMDIRCRCRGTFYLFLLFATTATATPRRALLSRRRLSSCECPPNTVYKYQDPNGKCGHLRSWKKSVYDKCIHDLNAPVTSQPGKCSQGCVLECPVGYECPGGVYTQAIAHVCAAGTSKMCHIATVLQKTVYRKVAFCSCKPCQPGRYNTEEAQSGDSGCKECPATFSCPGGTGRLSCQSGEYTESTNQTHCKTCEPGYSCRGSQQKYLGYGSYPKYSYTSGRAACHKGYYTSSYGTHYLGCKKCSAGRAAPKEGSSECVQCDLGTYANNYYYNVYYSKCSACLPGQYGHLPGQCSACQPSSYNNKSGSTTISDCKNCSVVGFFIPPDQSGCERCPPGTYGSKDEKYVCKRCSTGRCLTHDKGMCSSWSKSTYQNEYGQISCKDDCLAGSYILQSNVPGDNKKCLPCLPGKVSNQSNQQSCFLCPNGQYQNQSGQKQCNDDCPFGSGISNGNSVCVPCWKGKFSDGTLFDGGHDDFYRGYCQECPVGQYQHQTGQSSCVATCPVGFGVSDEQLLINKGIGSTSCTKCNVKYYSDEIGGSCKNCPAGWIGYFHWQYSHDVSGYVNQALCQECPVNTYHHQQYNRCTKCPKQTFTMGKTGAIASTDCKTCFKDPSNIVAQPVLWAATCTACTGVNAYSCENVTCWTKNDRWTGWVDGNNDPSDGCEKPVDCHMLSDKFAHANCTSCVKSFLNYGPNRNRLYGRDKLSFKCTAVNCDVGWLDFNGDATDGCEKER